MWHKGMQRGTKAYIIAENAGKAQYHGFHNYASVLGDMLERAKRCN